MCAYGKTDQQTEAETLIARYGPTEAYATAQRLAKRNVTPENTRFYEEVTEIIRKRMGKCWLVGA